MGYPEQVPKIKTKSETWPCFFALLYRHHRCPVLLLTDPFTDRIYTSTS